MQPFYTPANCNPAYELRWSLSIFAVAPLSPSTIWLETLKKVVERDGVRVLEHHLRKTTTHQFLISTKPNVSPPAMIKSVKGRLQHMVQTEYPRAFRRNFSLCSVGGSRRKVVEAYVANQLGHHLMADTQIEKRLAEFQITFPEVDLAVPQFSSHGRYLYNLHLVLVHDGRWTDVNEDRLVITRDMMIKSAAKKGHRLSRLAVLADHIHATLGCCYEETPEGVALSFLNNLAFAHGMRAVYRFGYFVGTFGEYDLGAIRQSL